MDEDALDDVLVENNSQYGAVEYAGFWIRAAASILDSLILTPIVLLTFYNIFNLKSMFFMFILTLLATIYKPLFEWFKGATPGKMAVKIKVVNEDLGRLSLGQAFGRYMPWLITQLLSLATYFYLFNAPNFDEIDSFLEMGEISQSTPLDTVNTVYNFIFIILVGSLVFDPRKQGMHDKIAKTFVIKVKK